MLIQNVFLPCSSVFHIEPILTCVCRRRIKRCEREQILPFLSPGNLHSWLLIITFCLSITEKDTSLDVMSMISLQCYAELTVFWGFLLRGVGGGSNKIGHRFFSPPVLMHGGLLCIALHPLLHQKSLDNNSYLNKSCS